MMPRPPVGRRPRRVGDNRGLMKTLDDWLAYCEHLHPKTIELGLERARAVAQRMNLRFNVPVFTVAGTNGKGSTCAMLEAILTDAGFRTGVFTSPHLVRFEERCRIRGVSVDASELIAAFARVESARAEISLTYFEFTTLAILDMLARAGFGQAQAWTDERGWFAVVHARP